MVDIKKLIRDDLKSFEAYESPEKPHRIKIDANESPFGLSEGLKNKIIDYIGSADFNRYPDIDNKELRRTIAQFYGKESENIICGVGSDQIIDILTKTFLNKGDIAVVIEPTFSMYAQSVHLNHGSVVKLSADGDFNITTEKIIEAVNKANAKILFLCTPNNPTGNIIKKEEIVKILENVECIVAVDEAYGEFKSSGIIDCIEKYNNLIVLKTFSKAFGLAGIRVGYAIGDEKIISALNLCRPPYNIPTLSLFIAINALRESDEYKNKVNTILRNRELFSEELKKFKFIKVYDSQANFVLIDTEKELYSILEDCGVLVRRVGFNNYENYKERLRISIGTRNEIEKVISIINNNLH